MSEQPRKALLLRIGVHARRVSLSLGQNVYLYLYAIPRLWLAGAIAAPFSISRGHGTFLLLSLTSFLKLAISSKDTIRKEYEHYLILTEAQPRLAELLPSYRLLQGALFFALQCECLVKIAPADALPPAVDLYRQFTTPAAVQRRLALSDCPQIQEGIRYIEAEFGNKVARAIQQLVLNYLAHGKYEVGLAHGDFHSRNIMRDSAGGCRLIDLDCIRFQGIREFDALYFALEQEWSASGRLWTETLGNCLTGAGDNVWKCMAAFDVAWSDGLGVAFFLDRLGQDAMHYGMRYARMHLESVLNAVTRTTAEHSE
jgi:hypothetical protein